MRGTTERGAIRGVVAVAVAFVVVLSAVGGITAATGAVCSAGGADCEPVSAAAQAVGPVGVLGGGVVGAPPNDDRRGPMNEADGEEDEANGDDEDDEKGAKGGEAAGSVSTGPGRSESAPTKQGDVLPGRDEANGDDAPGRDGANGDDAPGRDGANGDDAPGRDGANGADAPEKGDEPRGEDASGRDDAPGRETNGSAPGQAEATERGPPESVPTRVNVSTRGEANGRATTVVNASVRDVRANQRARIALEQRSEALQNRSNASDVAITAMELSPTRNGSFTLNVTAAERIDGSPEFASDDGTEAMSHIRVNHSISNAELNGTVGIDFRISKSRLADDGVDPENVALYRFENGSWTELPTSVVNETASAVRFRAVSPGLSEFAAGAKRARFSVETVDVAVDEIAVGDDLRVHVKITNDGGADGEFSAELFLDGSVVEQRSLTIAAGGQRQTLFDHRVEDSGEYEVRVNDVIAGSIVVQRSLDENTTTTARTTARSETAAVNDRTASDRTTTVSGTEVPEPVFHPVGLVLVVLAALVARVRRR